MKELVLVVWGPTKEEMVLLENIKKFASTISKEVTVRIHDTKSLGPIETNSTCVAFSGLAAKEINSCYEHWVAPTLKSMLPSSDACTRSKQRAKEIIIVAVEAILAAEKQEPTSTYVETPEGITVGSDGCQINITEQEAEHLKKIKDLLGGGKMIITKGDVRIEVE